MTARGHTDESAANSVSARDRIIITHTDLSVSNMTFDFVTESVAKPTDWQFEDPEHIVVVHRAGNLDTMEVEFERGPSGSARPRAGDIWVIPAERRYAALAQGSTVEFCEIRIPTIGFGHHEVDARVQHRDDFTSTLIESMHRAIRRNDNLSVLLSQSLAETLRLHLAVTLTHHRPAADVATTWTPAEQATIIDYLEDHLAGELTLSALAEHMGSTVGEFTRAFAATFHTTAYQYLMDRRIKRAKLLLAHTRRPISEIARDVGFSTASHFATTFRNRVGVTPSGYRRHT